MKFAYLTTATPGDTFEQRCEMIQRSGCTGVETILFPDTKLEHWQRSVQQATANCHLQLVAVILGGLALNEPRPLTYVHEAMSAIAELGTAVLLTPEYKSQDPLPLFPPYPVAPQQETERVATTLREIGAWAMQLNLPVWIEPVTQFESRFCRCVADALQMCDLTPNPSPTRSGAMKIVADTHNMNITEADMAASIRGAGAQIGHVHLSDNHRLLPGQGHIPFAPLLQALRDVNYDGWLSFECVAQGDFVSEVRRAIAWLMVQC